MVEVASILKALGGIASKAYGFFAKRFVQPKLEIKLVKVFRNRVSIENPTSGKSYLKPVYQYEIRVFNNSEHDAYHLRIIECDAEILEEYLDYFRPLFSHTHTNQIIYVNDTNTTRYQGWELATGNNAPPITKFIIKYENSKGRKFITEFLPNSPVELQNKFSKFKE